MHDEETQMFANIEASPAEWLNKSCFCITLDRAELHAAMEREAADPEFSTRYLKPREHLFSNVPVFLDAGQLERMTAVVRMIEGVSRLPAYRQAISEWAPEIARADPGPRGVLMGYDFHLSGDGPRLIEVNTNAGGSFLNALLGRAQRACCPEVENVLKLPFLTDFDAELIAMFKSEWALQRGSAPLGTIAIVDDEPESQYLYPEFLLAQQTFIRNGINAVIADARELHFDDGRLQAGDRPIDLVYNRLVDFSLERAEHAALRDAYVAGAVVVTPGPHHHAMLADKRNLTLFCDHDALVNFGASPEQAKESVHVPKTVIVTADKAETLWKDRKGLFFKPVAGHGAKAVYRGDKLTRSVWEHILEGGYVAQKLAPPGERMIRLDELETPRKTDIRLFTYDGRVLMAAARLYQGQTTNFRTPGGGFSPVLFL
jgi:glutathione synthase/RimK-type ligase-like ATP-grasp enzyme